MGTAAVSLIGFLVVLITAFTALADVVGLNELAGSSLTAAQSAAVRKVDSRVRAVSATVSGADVDIVIENRGRLKYAEPGFSDWEVIVRYQDSGGTERIEYISYASVLASGKWTVQQIYLDEPNLTAEIYEPGILNDDEEMVIRARLSNAPGPGTTNLVTVAPPEGGEAQIFFSG